MFKNARVLKIYSWVQSSYDNFSVTCWGASWPPLCVSLFRNCIVPLFLYQFQYSHVFILHSFSGAVPLIRISEGSWLRIHCLPTSSSKNKKWNKKIIKKRWVFVLSINLFPRLKFSDDKFHISHNIRS